AFLHNANCQTADDIDDRDQNPRDGISADEFAGTVHGSVEVGFFFNLLAARLRFFAVDHARAQIRIDTHLLTGNRIQDETGGDFGDASGTFGDDDEVNDDQEQKDHGPDNVTPPDDETAEGFNHMT